MWVVFYNIDIEIGVDVDVDVDHIDIDIDKISSYLKTPLVW
jgi:hypothetical protein